MKKILLIDGNSIANRAFYGLMYGNLLKAPDGTYTNAVYGFFNMIFKITDKLNPDYVGVAFDLAGKTKRHEKYEEYKAGRSKMPEELAVQMPIIKEILEQMNVPIFEKEGFEADDLIGTIAKKFSKDNIHSYLFTGDRDYFQLIDENITVILPRTKNKETIDEIWDVKKVAEEYSNLTPKDLIQVKGIMGDPSDNIRGVPGMGEKTAVKLISEYKSIDNIYEKIEKGEDSLTENQRNKLIENKEMAYLSLKLGKIILDCDIDVKLENLIKEEWSPKVAQSFERLGLNSFLERFNLKANSTLTDEDIEKLPEFILNDIDGLKKDLKMELKENNNNLVYTMTYWPIDKNETDIYNLWAKNIYFYVNKKMHVLNIYTRKLRNEIEDTKQISIFDNIYENDESIGDEKDFQIKNNIGYKRVQDKNDDYIYYLNKENIKIIKNIFEDKEIFKISHDMYKDILFMLFEDVEPKNMYLDIKIAMYLLNSSLNQYGMQEVISKYLKQKHLDVLTSDEYIEKNYIKEIENFVKELIDFKEDKEFALENVILKKTQEKELENKKLEYNKKDFTPFLIHKVYEKILEDIKKDEMTELLLEIEMPLLDTLVNMTNIGIKVDKEELESIGKMLELKIENLTDEIYKLAGEKFNINSTKQLGEILFEKLKLPVIKKTKTGYGTGVEVLEKLIGKHDIITYILEYRSISKINSSYVQGLLPYINKKDDRIHSIFNQTIAATGRISSSDPNLQSIPTRTDIGKQIRKVFVPKDGYIFLDSDYSQIELRVLAHMSGDKHMIEAFNEGKDIHKATASSIFNIPFDEVTPKDRDNAKAINFGIIYGISNFGLSEAAGITVKDAEEYIKKYLENFSNIQKFMDDSVNSAKENGYVKTLYNRRRYIPEIKSSNFNLRNFGKRAAMNAPIQGTAADIIKIAMIKIDQELEKKKLKSRIVLQIHDEILLEVKKEEQEEIEQLVNEIMNNIAQLKVPLLADSNKGSNWGDVH